MTEQDCRRNVILYYLFAIFNEPLFWGPILITSLQKLAGMSLPGIYYMEAVVLGICVVLDIPGGALADLIGRKRAIIIGRVFLFADVVFFMVMTNATQAWIGNILWAIGYILQSGADTSLLYDTLKEHGKESTYKKIVGQALGFRLIVIAFCSLACGYLADINLRLPLYLSLPFVVVPLVCALLFKEGPKTRTYSIQNQIAILKQGGKFVLNSKEIRWMVGFAALLAMTSKVWFFTYNPYFELVGVPLTDYGFIFFLLNAVAWLSSHFSHTIESRLGEKKCVVVMALCLAIPIILMGLVPIEPFAYLVLIQNVVRGFMNPFVTGYLHHHVTTDVRATVLSVQSTIANLAGIVGLAVFGYSTDTIGLLPSLVLLGTTMLTFGGISYWLYVVKIEK